MNDIKVQYLYDNCCNSLKIVNNFYDNYLKINLIEKITQKECIQYFTPTLRIKN